MKILNKRERKLFKLIKKEMKQNNTYTIEGNELHTYSSLLKKLKNSNLVFITYADNCAFIHDYNRLLQFEIEEKEERKITYSDYKIAIFSAIITGIITYIITILSVS